MKSITVIPARKTAKGAPLVSQQKLKVAAYCRVSTDSDEQATSYDAQIKYYTELIENNPEWTLAGIFADEGISGTNTKKRDEFNRMIEECKAENPLSGGAQAGWNRVVGSVMPEQSTKKNLNRSF